MKKALSVLLSVLIAITAIAPLMASMPFTANASKASDAYAVVFTASDFQADSCYTTFTATMQSAQADGITETPDAFLFAGDYTAGSEDPAVQVPKVVDTVQAEYSGYDSSNMVFVQGNHDSANDILTPTGFHEFENILVYSINEDNFKNSQLGNNRGEAYYQEIQTLAQDIAAEFEEVKNSGDNRPIFVVTHLPLHHMSRDNYGDNLYGKPIFDVLNEYGKYLDIIFLFGHNHSSGYDDYIGGSVNYIAKGEEIRIPIPDASQAGENGYTEETLSFTYMNAGYVGYSNNSTTAPSTNVLTMGAIELCTTTIEVYRYSAEGLYASETIQRVNPMTTDPYVKVNGETAGDEGNSDILHGVVANIDAASYTWSTSDDSVVKVLPAGKNAQVIYTGEGTADVTLTVTDKNGNTYSEKITIDVTGATKTETIPIPGETHSIYELTSTITAGKKYVLASRNTAGSTTAISTSTGTRVLNGGSVTVLNPDDNSDNNYIKNPDDNVVWTASKSGNNYLFENGGNYITATGKNSGNVKNNGLTLGDSDTANTAQWSLSGNILTNISLTSYKIALSGSNYTITTSGSNIYFYEHVRDYETGGGTEEVTTTAPYEPNVLFNKGSKDIDGQALNLYEVNFGDGFMIDGSFTGFSDKASSVTTTWSSSDPSVATVENGYVTMVGNGETVITYTVTDGTTTITKTVTLVLSDKEKPMGYFTLTDTLKDGELYIIASTNSVGTTAILTPPVIDTGKTDHRIRFSETGSTVQTINGAAGIMTSNESPIWRAVSTGTDGYFYLINTANGYYMYANDDAGTNDLGSTTDVSTNGTVWHINSEGFLASNDGIAIKHSGDNNFRACPESEAAGNYLYQKTDLKSWVDIRSKYQNVQGTTMTRTEVCPFQTETLLAVPQNFSVENESISLKWESSNPDVATIDNNGVVTYTGNPGTVEFTVYANSTVPNENGAFEGAHATTTIEVLPQSTVSADNFILTDRFVDGEYYVIAGANVEGSTYILGNEEDRTTSATEYRMNGVGAAITQESAGLTIANTDSDTIWQAEDAGNGYFRLKNAATGKYLALVADNNFDPYRRVVTADLGEYDESAYLISKNSNQVFSQQSYAYDANILRLSSGQFRLSASANYAYIYQKVSSDSLAPKTEIRVSTLLGTDDISNTLQNRNNISAGDTERVLRYTENIENITSTTWSVSDESIATIDENGLITYTGKEGFVTVTLFVTGTDADGEVVEHTVRTTFNVLNGEYEAPTEDYPEYPHEGSVRINKTASNSAGGYNFQTSGVTEVELSVTGVPLPQAVDVVVVLDHSSSMTNDGTGLRLTNAIANTRDFALQLVNSNRNNRIAIVTFDRYRDGYDDIADTTDNYTTDTSSKEDRIVTGDGTAEGAFMTFDDSEELIAQIDSLATNNTSGTNYDYGLREAYNILNAAKTDPEANKVQYVIFMSDGEPYLFNRLHIEYGTNDPDGLYEAWLRGDEESNTALQNALADPTTYPVTQFYNPDGENWFAQAIKAPEGSDISGLPTDDYYANIEKGLGSTIFTIGFEAGTPGTLTGDILTNMASSPDNYYYAEGDIQAAYDSILEKIVYAANNAVITDKMGESFNLQFAPSITLENGMATIVFDPAPYIEIGSWTLNSDGTRNKYSVVEKITFEADADGTLTAAYSNLLGSTNIYDSSANKIVGSKVSYDFNSETFVWNNGDITRDEVTLKYYAYLDGSAEGTKEAGVYETNEYAYIDYINYRGTQCNQVFPVPSLGWKEATVGYEFYLVNENGDPVNKNGIVVPFAERVLIVPEKTKSISLNTSDSSSALDLIAKEEAPEGYILFNPDTSYKISVSSGENPSRAEINDDVAIKTTYFRDGNITYKGHGVVPGVTDYMKTHVSFAVLRIGRVEPDSIVIDYGLPVNITVLQNDGNATAGVLNAIGTKLAEGTVLDSFPYEQSRMTDGVKTGLALANGSASIDGNRIVFTPSNLTMSTENTFYYEYVTESGFYLYTKVTVIPAANIYYEESFFTFNDGDGYVWQTAGESFTDKFQSEDRPGTSSSASTDANNNYGLDSAYDDSYTYSLGSAEYTSVDANAFGKEPTAEFSFCGTGFDLFSVTNNNTGAILVTVYKADGTRYKNYIVQTYYGFSYDAENDKYTPDLESGGCLYQVPVIRAMGLDYGTYKVVIKPLYSTMFDTANDGSYDIYVDSVRIYNPAGQTPAADSVIGSAYLEDSEYNPSFTELRRTILDAKTFYSDAYILEGESYGKGSIFIDSIGSLDENGISDKYLEAGPNNEVYLAKGQAIAFHLKSDKKISPSNVELGMKTVSGKSSKVALMNSNEIRENYITVSGAHEMFRGLSSVIVWDEAEIEATGIYKTKYPIVIINTSDSILSLTSLKWAYENDETTAELQVVVDPSISTMAYSVTKSVMAEFPYTDEDIQMEWSDTSLVEGKDATITITTPADIEKITIDGIEITEFEVDENGNKVWTYTFTVVEVGEKTYDILLYANTGKVSQPMITETITVKEYSAIALLFDAILDFIKKILLLFRRVFA